MSGKIGITMLAIISAICVASVTARAFPARTGMYYYPRAQPLYYRPATHSMYIQYGQSPYRANLAAVQDAGVSAFASGNKIAAETFYKDTTYEAPQYEVPVKADEENVVSVAESYPEFEGASDDETAFQQPADEAAPADVPIKVNAPAEDALVNVNVKKPAQLYPVDTTVNRKKKVYVKLDEKPEDEAADDDDDEDEEAYYVPVPSKKKKQSSNGKNPGSGITSYFPISFGSTAGGAIAIANSFSTGKGGTATSHATAYGSPSGQTKRRMASVPAQED